MYYFCFAQSSIEIKDAALIHYFIAMVPKRSDCIYFESAEVDFIAFAAASAASREESNELDKIKLKILKRISKFFPPQRQGRWTAQAAGILETGLSQRSSQSWGFLNLSGLPFWEKAPTCLISTRRRRRLSTHLMHQTREIVAWDFFLWATEGPRAAWPGANLIDKF